jgi:hypothetical protein
MDQLRKWARILAAGVALLLVVAFAARCGPEEETPTPSVATEEVPTPEVVTVVTESVVIETVTETVEEVEEPPSPELPGEPTSAFVPGQVIISGPLDQVSAAVDRLGDMDMLETQLKRLNLEEAGINPGECDTIKDYLAILGECFESGELWVLDLYQLAAPEPEAVVEASWAINREEFPCVFLHPNYLLGDPWTGVGSPWTGVGSPWTGVGSPAPGAGAMPALQSDFRGQWAFDHIGLYDQRGDRQVIPTGAGVRIGVFDTSPFELEEGDGPSSEFIHWAVDPFTLTVWHPEFLAPLPAPTETKPVSLTLANHGLFAVGLAHEVAPESEIHLYRVLDEYVQGDLFTMDAAIFHFITETLAAGGGPQGAVINLSLGIHPLAGREDLGLPPEVMALELLLAGARCHGMAVVASAGNDRVDGESAPPPHIPARYEFVLGVAASNDRRRPACFSNQGQVAAPGGDGEERCTHCSQDSCRWRSLISLVFETPPGYAYWAGTSFAAPLTSGQAALLLESGVDPFAVHEIIMTSSTQITDMGNVVDHEIIDLPNSLP